jgi:site-specific DNA-methyltransferase (adenine-specific)
VVLDPFAGSGTTLAVAKKLGRCWLGFELSEKYAKKATERLDRVQEGQPLAGAPEPLVSAPQTPKTNGRAKTKSHPDLPLFRGRRKAL